MSDQPEVVVMGDPPTVASSTVKGAWLDLGFCFGPIFLTEELLADCVLSGCEAEEVVAREMMPQPEVVVLSEPPAIEYVVGGRINVGGYCRSSTDGRLYPCTERDDFLTVAVLALEPGDVARLGEELWAPKAKS